MIRAQPPILRRRARTNLPFPPDLRAFPTLRRPRERGSTAARLRLAFCGATASRYPWERRREAGIATFNEMFDGDRVRPAYERLLNWVQTTSPEVLAQKKQEAEALFRRIGITFAVYGEGGDTERLIPFDMMPRVFTEAEWRRLEKGVKQRARALNRFLHDVYHRAEIVRAGVVPGDLVFRNEAYEPAVVGIDPAGRGLQPHRRHRPRAHRAGRVLRARGQLPHPFGRQLHAREPRDHDADVPRALPGEPHRAGRRLSRTPAPHARERRPAQGRGRSGLRDPVAGRVQQRLLRALVPRRPDGHRARRGAGPLRAGRFRLHAHHRGAEARRRHLSPDRRQLPRSAVLPPRLDARGARA